MTSASYLTGLIGRNISASRSPHMHECEARAQGVTLNYKLFDFAAMGSAESELPVILKEAQDEGYSGVNVTHPYKRTIVQYLDDLSEGARRIGAVNTVAMTGDKLVGHNTDEVGFAQSFRHGLMDAPRKYVVQIGAGGAGAATANALIQVGVERLVIYDLEQSRAQSLVEDLATHYDARKIAVAGPLVEALAAADGAVNATPMGMAEHPGLPIPIECLRPDLWVTDIVYFPLETALLKAAKKVGCRTVDGSVMAVYQAAAAFEIFTGLEADAERMHSAFLSYANEVSSR